MKTFQTILLASLAVFMVVGVVSCEVSLWQECRSQHSWLYCMRTLSK